MSGLPKTTYSTLAVLLVYEIIGLLGGLVTPVVAENSDGVKEYPVYWNVPTFMCRKYNITFDEVVHRYGIIQNPNDDFNGSIIYNLDSPGMFPEIRFLDNGTVNYWNGGVPQRGDLEAHLNAFRETVARIPSHAYARLVVINQTMWRPTYRQHEDSIIYSGRSDELVRSNHPDWKDEAVHAEAVREFEEGAKKFMEETLKAAKVQMPRALWGYYAFPECFKEKLVWGYEDCSPEVLAENDKLSWLPAASDVILPVVQLRPGWTMAEQRTMIRRQVREAVRMATMSTPKKMVLVYFDYGFADRRDIFLNTAEFSSGAKEIMDSGADGYIIWGKQTDFDSEMKCLNFMNHIKTMLGPSVLDAKGDSVFPDAVSKS